MPCSWRRGQDTVRLVADPASNPGRAPWREWTLVHLIRRQAGERGDAARSSASRTARRFTFRALDAWTTSWPPRWPRSACAPGDRVLGLRRQPRRVDRHALRHGEARRRVGAGQHGPARRVPRSISCTMPSHASSSSRIASPRTFATSWAGPVAPEAVVIVGDAATPTPACLTGARRLTFAELHALPGAAPISARVARARRRRDDHVHVGHDRAVEGRAHAARPLLPVRPRARRRRSRSRADDRYFVCMPLFHANALLMQFVGCLMAGAEVIVAERFRATSWLEDVRAAGATITNGLGVIPEFIFRQPPDRPRPRPPPAPDDGGADRGGVGRRVRGALRGAASCRASA